MIICAGFALDREAATNAAASRSSTAIHVLFARAAENVLTVTAQAERRTGIPNHYLCFLLPALEF